jgi:hypothetical protein
MRERKYVKELDLDGIILQWTFKKWGGGGMDWIDLAEDRERWWTLVNAVVNLRVPWSSLFVGSSFNLACVY